MMEREMVDNAGNTIGRKLALALLGTTMLAGVPAVAHAQETDAEAAAAHGRAQRARIRLWQALGGRGAL